MSAESIKRARIAVQRAEEKLEAEIANTHPPGSIVNYDKRGSQTGTVNYTGKRSLSITNNRTGTKYWLDIFHVHGLAE